MRSLEEARAYQQQEQSRDTADLWAAILAAHDALVAMGGPGLPDLHVNKARANLIRAGVTPGGNYTDDELAQIATADGVRVWRAYMGTLFKNEPIIGEDGETYIVLRQHEAQAMLAPGTIGGRTLFRLLRREPEQPGDYLTFQWGERVPYGAVRRDPLDGQLYTPIHLFGVTLYEPHYPHLVPSEYKPYKEKTTEPAEPADPEEGGETEEPQTGGEAAAYDDWEDLRAAHIFAPGTYFTCEGKLYKVLRTFTKMDHWKPPALNGDFYEEVE